MTGSREHRVEDCTYPVYLSDTENIRLSTPTLTTSTSIVGGSLVETKSLKTGPIVSSVPTGKRLPTTPSNGKKVSDYVIPKQ